MEVMGSQGSGQVVFPSSPLLPGLDIPDHSAGTTGSGATCPDLILGLETFGSLPILIICTFAIKK